MNELVFRGENGTPMTTSLLVAEAFGKKHCHVLRDIENLDCSDEFTESNFGCCMKIRELANGVKKQDRYYNITKDGFTFLAMGYTGKKAAEFKEKYIAAFNAMERTIQQGAALSQQFMEMQMQMMSQMMNLCNTMMQRIERMESAHQPMQKEEPKPKTVGRIPKNPGVLIGYSRLRREYPGYITGTAASKVLKERGVDVSSRYLFEYMRKNGYLHAGAEWFNCPTDESVRNGYMIGITGSGRYGRSFHTPYLSPSFVELLERQLREDGIGVPRQLSMPFGKEVAE